MDGHKDTCWELGMGGNRFNVDMTMRGVCEAWTIKTGEDHVSCFLFFFCCILLTSYNTAVGGRGGMMMVYHMVSLMMTFPVTTHSSAVEGQMVH